MKEMAIHDANILIDLITIGLFGRCMTLSYQFMTTNLIFDELYAIQQELVKPHILSGRLAIHRVSAEELIEITSMATKYPKLSEQDCSGIHVAVKESAILLSGDSQVKKIAEKLNIKVHGILWILDELVASGNLENNAALILLEQLMIINGRLPRDECAIRLRKWKS